jgi:hypothetical protein
MREIEKCPENLNREVGRKTNNAYENKYPQTKIKTKDEKKPIEEKVMHTIASEKNLNRRSFKY